MAGRARAAAAGPVAAATGGRHPAPEGPPPRQVSAHRPRYPPRAPPPPPPHRGGASLSVGGRPGSSPQGSGDGRRHSLTHPAGKRPPQLEPGQSSRGPRPPSRRSSGPRRGGGRRSFLRAGSRCCPTFPFTPRRAPPASRWLPRGGGGWEGRDCHISGCWNRWL